MAQKRWEMIWALILYEIIRSQSTNLYTICAPSRNLYQQKAKEHTDKGTETKTVAKLTSSLPLPTQSSSTVSVEF